MTNSDLLAMSVSDMAFLVDKLHEDCSPMQFVRELTKNSIEAIQRTSDATGEVVWDLDWFRFDQTSGAQSKLCLIDNGVGMTGAEMVKYINQLSSSVHQQTTTGNFGVGAKISAAPLNPHGMLYLSWKDGTGYMIHLFKDPSTRQYGLRRFDTGEFWSVVDDEVRPKQITKDGTMVVLLGDAEEIDTMVAPPSAKMKKKWVLRYLNSRFLRFPDGVTVKAREGWELEKGDKHNFLRQVKGQGVWLNQVSSVKGNKPLSEAKATIHWWILDEDADTNSGHYTPGGHVGMIYQNEIYEIAQGSSGYAKLQSFGVVFGCDRVVIYVEPWTSGNSTVVANTPRTHLIIDDHGVDWSMYASEFRSGMPDELVEFQDKLGLSADHTDHKKAIRERLKAVRELFRFGRYRPNPTGAYSASAPSSNSGGNPGIGSAKKVGSSTSGGQGGSRGDIYSLFAANGGEPADLVRANNEPEVQWVSVKDNTRSVGDLEDRAARYLPDQNKILVNGDFRAFTDMIERWSQRYQNVAGSDAAIKVVVQEWFSQQLMEAIMSALALKQSGKWSTEEATELWTESALTAVVLPRYHVDVNIKRSLGQKLGKSETAA